MRGPFRLPWPLVVSNKKGARNKLIAYFRVYGNFRLHFKSVRYFGDLFDVKEKHPANAIQNPYHFELLRGFTLGSRMEFLESETSSLWERTKRSGLCHCGERLALRTDSWGIASPSQLSCPTWRVTWVTNQVSYP